MKISQYKVYDVGTSIGAEGAQYVAGKLEVGGTANSSKSWLGIPEKNIIAVHKINPVSVDVAWKQIWTPAVFTVGNKFVLTISYDVSRQKSSKVFRHVVVTGDAAASVVTAFKALINGDSELPITATGTTTLILTANVAGTGFNHIVTGGGEGASTFTGGAVTADARITDSDYFSEKFENVDASDFGVLTTDYIGYIISYQSSDAVSGGNINTPRNAAIFIEGATTVTALEDALNSDWTPTPTDGGAAAITSSKGKYDSLA